MAGSESEPAARPQRLGAWAGIVILLCMFMLCATVFLCTSIYSSDQREAHIQTAESEAKEAASMADYQKSLAMTKIKEVDELREKLEKENRRNVGGAKTKSGKK